MFYSEVIRFSMVEKGRKLWRKTVLDVVIQMLGIVQTMEIIFVAIAGISLKVFVEIYRVASVV